MRVIIVNETDHRGLYVCRDRQRGCSDENYLRGVPCASCIGPIPESTPMEELEGIAARNDA